jgi:hypothetical protein
MTTFVGGEKQAIGHFTARSADRPESRSASILAWPPPSTSGLGHSPFKAAARVRIPLGAMLRFAQQFSLHNGRCSMSGRSMRSVVGQSRSLRTRAQIEAPTDDLSHAAVDSGIQVCPAGLRDADRGHVQVPELVRMAYLKEAGRLRLPEGRWRCGSRSARIIRWARFSMASARLRSRRTNLSQVDWLRQPALAPARRSDRYNSALVVCDLFVFPCVCQSRRWQSHWTSGVQRSPQHRTVYLSASLRGINCELRIGSP